MSLSEAKVTFKYSYHPHNIWFAIIKSIRDLILKYKCPSLIFREVVPLPLLSDCDGIFSRCSALIGKMHADIRIIFQSGEENLVYNSFYYLLTCLTETDFEMGDKVIDVQENILSMLNGGEDLKQQQQQQTQTTKYDSVRMKINYTGEREMWLDLIRLIEKFINFFKNILTTYCIFLPLNSHLRRCTNDLVESLSNKMLLVRTIMEKSNSENDNSTLINYSEVYVDDNKSGVVDRVYDLSDNKFEFEDLIYIPKRKWCFLFDNLYLESNVDIYKTHVYNINVQPIVLINL